jgi:transcription initiation factor TFIIIB Brf1 subunit/transcription initiation factor TFIIB
MDGAGEIFFGTMAERACAQGSRCKSSTNAVMHGIAQSGVPEEIAAHAMAIYRKITGGHIYRGTSRKQLQFYAAYNAYLESGYKPDPINLGARINLDAKKVRKSFTRFGSSREYAENNIVICMPHDFVFEHAELIGLDPARAQRARDNIEQLARILHMTPASMHTVRKKILTITGMIPQTSRARGGALYAPTLAACVA